MTKKKRAIFTSLVLVASCFPLAFDLGQAPIQTWDEARQAVNAYEMLHSGGQWLITTFDHQPDLGNTKPPLLIWLQALSMGLFGATELAVRLPSLLAAVGTVGLLYAAGRGVGRPGAGLLAGAVLTTTAGYLGPHLARTGDYEALLCLGVLGQVLATFAYAETGRPRYLAVAAAAVAGAVLTKGVAGLLALPALLTYLLWHKKLSRILRQPAFWYSAAGALVLPGLFYLLRERALPGYWAAVRGNELGGRYLHNLSAATPPPLYHVQNLLGYQLRPWWPLLPVAAGVLALGPPTAAQRLAGLAGLVAGGWLLVISLAQTKLEWYPAPMLPPLALLLGLGLEAGFQRVRQLGAGRLTWPRLLAGAGLALVIAVPYVLTIKRLLREHASLATNGGLNSYGPYLRQHLTARPGGLPRPVYWPTDYGGGWVFQFYKETLASRGLALRRCHPDSLPAALPPGACVLVYRPLLRTQLHQRYAVQLLDQRGVCSLYEVRSAAPRPAAAQTL